MKSLVSKKLLFPVFSVVGIGLILGTALSHNTGALVPGVNMLVSVNSAGTGEGNMMSPNGNLSYLQTPMSANGKYVAFYSSSSDFVANDTNGKEDVFVRNLETNTTTRVNVSSTGVEANQGRFLIKNPTRPLSEMQNIAISRTGRYVAFASGATNLIDGQTTPDHLANQIYLRDTKLNTTVVVTRTASGDLGYGNPGKHSPMYLKGVSDDGRFILWGGYRNVILDPSTPTYEGTGHAYLTDMKDHSTRLLTVPSGYSGSVMRGHDASMSCDGSVVVFTSELVFDPSDTNAGRDLFLVDIRNGYSTKRLTNVSAGKHVDFANISCSGQYITFSSSDGGFSTLFPGTSGYQHFVYDRLDDKYDLVTVSETGNVGNVSHYASIPSAVDDKGNVVFTSGATNLVSGTPPLDPANWVASMYFRHYKTGVIEILSRNMNNLPMAVGYRTVSISADGSKVTYGTPAHTLNWGVPMFTGATNITQVIYSETGL